LVNVDEVLQQTSIHKSTRDLVDDRSRRTHVSFQLFCTCTIITIIENINHFNRKILKVDSLKHYVSHCQCVPQYLRH